MGVPYYGPGSLGFIPKPLDACLAELQDEARALFGQGISFSPASKWSQFLGILAERYADLWDMAQTLAAQRDPDQATGAFLDAISALTGTVRRVARRSTVLATLVGDAGTVVFAYSQASVEGGAKFRSTVEGALAAVDAWGPAADVLAGERRSNGGRVYEATQGGVTGGAGGPVGTGADIVDGSVHWRHLGEGGATIDVIFESVEPGAYACAERALTKIETPVVGWKAITNAEAAELGGAAESDAELRIRREQELALSGSSSLDAIRAEVLNVGLVTSATVFENDTEEVDADGIPPHAFEVLVSGDLSIDAEIRAAIFRSKAAGVRAHGQIVGTVTDSAGREHTIGFTRATKRDLFVVVDLEVDANTFPDDGADRVKAAIVAAATERFAAGVDVTSWALKKAISVSGVVDVPSLAIGWAADPVSEARLVVGSREQAIADASRITVGVTYTAP